LKRATAAVRAAASNTAWRSDDKLAAVDEVIKSNAVLGEVWAPYRAALRADPERDGGYLNPVDPHAWFALERLPGRGYEKWASTLAGVSLTVGLLFTFVGLSAALFKVGEAGSNTAELRQAIAEILRISSAKFITSMAGIVAYIGWTVAARAHASKQAKVVARFASAVQALSVPVTPESLLLGQLIEAKEQSGRLKTLKDDLAVVFDSSLNRIVGPHLDALPAAVGRVVDAIQGVGSSIGQGNQAAMESLIGQLMSAVKDAAGRDMSLLVEAMQAAARELSAAKSGIGDGGAEFGRVLTAAAEAMNHASAQVAEAMQRGTGEIEVRMQRIDELLSSGATRFGSIGESMGKTLTEGLRHGLQGIAVAASASAANAGAHVRAQFEPLFGELQKLTGQIRTSAEETSSALAEGGRSAADQLDKASSKASETLNGGLAGASEALAKSFGESTARILEAVEGAVAGYRAATESLATRLGVVEQGLGAVEQAVRRNVDHLSEAGGVLTDAGRSFGAATDQLRQAAAPVVSTLQRVEGAAASVRDALQVMQEASGALRQAGASMASGSEAAKATFESYKQQFEGVDEALGRTFAAMRDGFVAVSNEVTNTVGHYDEHLRRAVGTLSAAVEEIAEAVNGLDGLAASAVVPLRESKRASGD
jgi:hypothetical protein